MAPDRKHEKARQPFVCPDCGLQYAGDSSRHRRQHQANRQDLEWTCKSCGFGDLQRYNVLEHYVRTHTTDEPHECPLTTKDARPCSFKCQSSSVLTKHKKDVHKYNPKTDKVPQSSRSGKLAAYERFITPPKAHRALSARESSSDAPQIPSHDLNTHLNTQTLSFPVPPSVSAASYPPSNMDYQASYDQLSYAQPSGYRNLPKQEKLDVGSFTTSFISVPHANAWVCPPAHYPSPNTYRHTTQWEQQQQPPNAYPGHRW